MISFDASNPTLSLTLAIEECRREKKKELITNPNHLVLITSHPSPFSARRGFLGSNHFRLANEYLIENNLDEINWRLK